MKKLLILLVLLLTACQPSSEMIQTAIAQTVAAYTPTPEPTSTATLIPVDSWRVAPYPGATDLVTDVTAFNTWDDTVKNWSVRNGVSLPFRWECYYIAGTKTFNNVAFHYTQLLRARGYAIEYNNYIPEDGIGWMVYSLPYRNVYLEVLDQEGNENTAVFVAYKEVN